MDHFTIDEDGIKFERIFQLKKSRSSAKGAVTKKRKELIDLMKNTENFEQVRSKVVELLVRKFIVAHDKYHAELIYEIDTRDSSKYCVYVECMV